MQKRQEVLIYDEKSQNNQHRTPTIDQPQPASPQLKMEESSTSLFTTTIHVRSNQSKNQQSKFEEPQKKEKERKKSDNIIFFEEEIRASTNSVENDQTNRGFLKKNNSSDEEDYDEDEVEELEQLKQEEEEEQTEPSSKRKIVPTQKTLENKEVLVTANVELMIYQPVPKNYRIKCYIIIQRGLLGFAHIYRLFLGKEMQFLMSAKKETMKYYSNFIISKHPHQIHKRGEEWMGRLEANVIGTQFKYYSVKDQFQTLKMTVDYDRNFVGFMGPRSFSAAKVDPKAKKGKYINSLASILQRNQRSKLILMKTAEPTLLRGKYRLDFEGKVRVPSSKNFILKHGNDQSLLFGKVDKDSYLMEVGYPLSPFEAFGVCLTSLDSKLMVS